MIYILHGEDTLASYNSLLKLTEKYGGATKIKLAGKNTIQDFESAATNLDIFSEQKILICENFISSGKIKSANVQNIDRDLHVFFWEHVQLSPAQIAKFEKISQIENFKSKTFLFTFLDSLSPGSKRVLSYFEKLEDPNETKLLWHVATRTLLMILVKENVPIDQAQKIIGRPIHGWQWDKIEKQAAFFPTDTLRSMFHGIVKLDFIIKSGQTGLREKELIPILLLKYLKPSMLR